MQNGFSNFTDDQLCDGATDSPVVPFLYCSAKTLVGRRRRKGEESRKIINDRVQDMIWCEILYPTINPVDGRRQ